MQIHETIRTMREIHQLTQEEMAEKLGISINGYSKIERGKSKLSLEKLEQIASLFKVSVSDLYSAKEKGVLYFLSEHHGSNYYQADSHLILEIKELKLILQHKDEMIEQLKHKNLALEEIITLLKTQLPNHHNHKKE